MASLRQYENVPLIKIHPWTSIPAGVPLFETCQVWENVGIDMQQPFSVGDLECAVEEYFNSVSDPVTLLVFPGTRLEIRMLFDRSRLAPTSAERMLSHLETWPTAVPDSGERRVAELPLLTAAEAEELGVRCSGPQKPLPMATVHGLIADRARREPDALAVEDDEGTYTYRELDERANQIARALQEMGVGIGSRVGLSTHRCRDMVAALLGVLKANAAYVPLDPAFPPARLSFMAEDAQLAALIAHEDCLDPIPVSTDRVLFLDRDCDASRANHGSSPPPLLVEKMSPMCSTRRDQRASPRAFRSSTDRS